MQATARKIRELIEASGSKFFSVEFVKKDGSLRKINGHLRYVPGHDGINPAAHVEKYVTVVLAEKDEFGNEQFRNVNCETVKSLSVNGKKYIF